VIRAVLFHILLMFRLMCFRADELVKRVFTLEFFPRRHSLRILKSDMINSVRRHALDMGSAESKSKICLNIGILFKYSASHHVIVKYNDFLNL
jgi:hypothetical protein